MEEMNDMVYTNAVATLNHYAAMASASDKDYITPDPSKSKRCASFDDLLQDFYSPEEIAEMRELAAAQTVGHELTSMRIRAGISQKMMAAALGVSQPRISAIETAPNSKISLQSIQKYVEVTRCSFKAVLEDGTVVRLTYPGTARKSPRRKKATVPGV